MSTVMGPGYIHLSKCFPARRVIRQASPELLTLVSQTVSWCIFPPVENRPKLCPHKRKGNVDASKETMGFFPGVKEIATLLVSFREGNYNVYFRKARYCGI